MEEIYVDVFGVKARICTSLSDFAQFLRQNYRLFLTKPSHSVDVDISFSSDAGEKASGKRHTLNGAGMGIYLGDDKLYWENEFGFQVLLSLNDRHGFNISAFHQDLLNSRGIEERYKNFQRSMRWAVHFPIFTLLHERNGLELVHASAVARDGQALIFSGLNGVGKSTLAMFLHRNRGYELMSDNFLLAGSDGVYGFPEAIRMSPEAVDRFGIQTLEDQKIYGKYHIQVCSEQVCLNAQPKACFLVTSGRELELVRMDASRAWMTLQGMHAFLGEFPETSYMALVAFLLRPEKSSEHPESTVSLRHANWFHLSYPLDWNIERLAEVIEDCI